MEPLEPIQRNRGNRSDQSAHSHAQACLDCRVQIGYLYLKCLVIDNGGYTGMEYIKRNQPPDARDHLRYGLIDYTIVQHQELDDSLLSAQGGGGSFKDRKPIGDFIVSHGWQSKSTERLKSGWRQRSVVVVVGEM